MKTLFKGIFFFVLTSVFSVMLHASSYSIKSGWNLIGTGLSEPTIDLNASSFGNSIILIWVYDTQQGWQAYSKIPLVKELIDTTYPNSHLTRIKPGTGIWVLSDSNTSLQFENLLELTQIFTGSVKTDVSGSNIGIADVSVTLIGAEQNYTTLTDINGSYALYDIPYGQYDLKIAANNFFTIEGRIELSMPVQSYPQVIMQSTTNSNSGYTHTFTGKILDAITGLGISGALVKIVPGLDNSLGTMYAQTITNQDGTFNFESVPSNNYTVISTQEGYITTTNNIQLISTTNGNVITHDYTLPPYSEDTRVVLTWGTTPYDLDSHFVKMVNSSQMWHIYYSDQTTISNEANLDVDDTSSYGPETITISTLENNATYKYYVHNYSDSESVQSSTLSNSGAQVKIYRNNQEFTYNVPNLPGTVWKVFEISNGEVIPCVGTCMSYASSSSSSVFGLLRPIDNNQEINFQALPVK